ELRVLQVELLWSPLEELGVLGVGPRPAALDEPHAELVEQARDGELVGDGQGDALSLGAVAQGGVEDVEAVVWHRWNSRVGCCRRRLAQRRTGWCNKKDPSWTREVGAPAGSVQPARLTIMIT